MSEVIDLSLVLLRRRVDEFRRDLERLEGVDRELMDRVKWLRRAIEVRRGRSLLSQEWRKE